MSTLTDQPAATSFLLKDHRQVEREVASDLRQLRDFARQLKLDETTGQIGGMLMRVESRSFSIAVVGEFKRGKSTFINALLGKEILPADIVPTSATLNRVTFGPKPAVRIFFKPEGGEPERVEDIAIDQLADYVTKLTPEAAAVAATVREAVVYYPVPYCRIYNMDIIDTPGLGDEATMTAVTMQALSQVDVAIMVIMADSPFSESEGNFLDLLLARGLDRVIFVVTALDRIRRSEDRPRVVREIGGRIERRIQQYAEAEYGHNPAAYDHYLKRVGHLRVFGLSGYQALEAKRTNNADMFDESGFAEFELALDKFLSEESSTLALRARAAQVTVINENILQQIQAQGELLQQQRQAFATRRTLAETLLEVLQQMSHNELRYIDEAASRIENDARSLSAQLEIDLKKSALEVIEKASVTPDDLDKYDALSANLRVQLEEGTHKVGQRLLEQVQATVQNGLAQEKVRLYPFAITFDRITQHVSTLTAQMKSENQAPIRDSKTDSLLAKLGGKPGYDQPAQDAAPEPRLKELASGLVLPSTWIETALHSLLVRDSLSVPPAENWLARQARQLFRVNNFKAALNQATTAAIEEQLRGKPVAAAISMYDSLAFDILKREIGGLLNRIQSQLLELHRQGERIGVLTERRQHDLETMQSEVERIRSRNQRLSAQLVELLENTS